MMTMIRALVSAIFLTLSGASSFAQPVAVAASGPEVKWAAGDVLRYQDSGYYGNNPRYFTLTFKEYRGEDMIFVFRWEDGEGEPQERTYDKFGNLIRTPTVEFSPNNPWVNLEAMVSGKEWTAKYVDKHPQETKSRTRTATPVGQEGHILTDTNVVVPSYKIRAYNKWDKAERAAPELYSYCPTLNMVCAYQATDFNAKWRIVDVRRR